MSTTLRRSSRLTVSSSPSRVFEVDDDLLFQLTIETTRLLQNCQKELKKVKWTNGESNTDTDYSRLACQCCLKAWKKIQQEDSSYQAIFLACQIPDINLTFDTGNKKITKKIELKSSKSYSIPGSTVRLISGI